MPASLLASPRKVAVVGISLADCGRVDDATPYALHAQAARRALADAGLDRSVIDGFASAGLGALPPGEVAEYLGLRPTWVESTAVGGAAWEVMAAHAADAITAGHANAVLLVYGSTARADIRAGRRTGNLSFGARGPLQFEVPYGHSLIAKYAMAALVTLEDLGFCAKGEGGAFMEKGRTGLTGELPVNTDGGGLSACHPGMRGLFLLVEAVRQLRGEAGARQVHRQGGGLPELAVASGTGGWFCSSATVVLGRG